MNLAIEFPSVVYREGPEAVADLAEAIERIGYDQIDIFDHVVMGHPAPGRPEGPYPAKMPLLEALIALGFISAVTEAVGLGTEVLVLPQRQIALAAKQVSTLDTLSAGRVRLGVGVGWQQSEYEALGMDFSTRGAMLDDAIPFLRHAFGEDPVQSDSKFFQVDQMAMEPKPPQGRDLPIWVGGGSKAALRRAGTLGDGWLAPSPSDLDQAADDIATVRRHAEEAGRDADRIGFQVMVTPPPGQDGSGRDFYANPEEVAAYAAELKEAGFGWGRDQRHRRLSSQGLAASRL